MNIDKEKEVKKQRRDCVFDKSQMRYKPVRQPKVLKIAKKKKSNKWFACGVKYKKYEASA
ncbi:MAG: hypothetical protein DHS20C08_15690 [Rhodomicrobium sp.]|nr:MAG: hypothetical protein DHS20C08_15690 [Rhodomicrobium sp.]